MNLFTLSASDQLNPVICYQGSFDPPHDGHVSALKAAIEKTHAIAAIVVVCNGENIDKPLRSSWEARKHMATICFSHLQNTTISQLPEKETKAILLQHAYVITLIGADAWPKYSRRPNIPFQAICISLRNGEQETQYPKIIQGKEIICVEPDVQGLSSNQIRQYLKFHPQFFEDSSGLPQLPSKSLEYIIENKMYYQSKENRLKEVEEGIKKYVAQHIFPNKLFQFQCLTDTNGSNSKYRGKSGDLTFLVSCDEHKIFIKGYLMYSHFQDFRKEISGIEALNRLPLRFSKGPEIIYWQESNPSYSHIGIPFFEESDLATIFQTPNCNTAIHKFLSMCFQVGRALSELHHINIVPIEQESLTTILETLNQRTKGRLKKLPFEQQEIFSSAYYSSYEIFMKNPGPHTYVHGDASLSNFLVEEKQEIVRMIDLGSFFLAQTEEGLPRGLPAEDYYRFLGDLTWLNGSGLLEPATIVSAKEAFKNGYLTQPSLITEEAHNFFSNYWSIRNYKLTGNIPNITQSKKI